MTPLEWLASALLVAGGFFYLAGTVGLLRFPDVHSRLHALTKADNVGLFFVCAAMALLSRSWRVAALLAVVWVLALLAASVSSHLIARRAERRAASKRGHVASGDRPTYPSDEGRK